MKHFKNLEEVSAKYQNFRIDAPKNQRYRRQLRAIKDGDFYVCEHTNTVPWDCGCSWECESCNINYHCQDCGELLSAEVPTVYLELKGIEKRDD